MLHHDTFQKSDNGLWLWAFCLLNRHRIIRFHKYGKTRFIKFLLFFFSKFKRFWLLFWVCWSCIIKICWIKISKNTPEKTFFIFVLNVCNCFLFQDKIRKWDIRRPSPWFIINRMNFKIEYFFKIPTATIPLINSNFFWESLLSSW